MDKYPGRMVPCRVGVSIVLIETGPKWQVYSLFCVPLWILILSDLHRSSYMILVLTKSDMGCNAQFPF